MSNELSKAQKAVPASLLKQLLATAAVMCFDHCMTVNTMSTPEFQKRIFNMYHGNADLNIISQLDLLLNGKGIYSPLYRDSEGQTLDKNTEPSNKDIMLNCYLRSVGKKLHLQRCLVQRMMKGTKTLQGSRS